MQKVYEIMRHESSEVDLGDIHFLKGFARITEDSNCQDFVFVTHAMFVVAVATKVWSGPAL